MEKLLIKLMNDKARGPERAYNGVGFDCFAFGDHILSPGQTKIIPLGFMAALEPGHAALVWDRGSVGAAGIHSFHELVLISVDGKIAPFAGVIDPDYRGQYGAVLHNFGDSVFAIKHQQKIVQILIQKCETPEIEIVDELPETERGARALGSTDIGTTAEQAAASVAGGETAPAIRGRIIEANAANHLMTNQIAEVSVESMGSDPEFENGPESEA